MNIIDDPELSCGIHVLYYGIWGLIFLRISFG